MKSGGASEEMSKHVVYACTLQIPEMISHVI